MFSAIKTIYLTSRESPRRPGSPRRKRKRKRIARRRPWWGYKRGTCWPLKGPIRLWARSQFRTGSRPGTGSETRWRPRGRRGRRTRSIFDVWGWETVGVKPDEAEPRMTSTISDPVSWPWWGRRPRPRRWPNPGSMKPSSTAEKLTFFRRLIFWNRREFFDTMAKDCWTTDESQAPPHRIYRVIRWFTPVTGCRASMRRNPLSHTVRGFGRIGLTAMCQVSCVALACCSSVRRKSADEISWRKNQNKTKMGEKWNVSGEEILSQTLIRGEYHAVIRIIRYVLYCFLLYAVIIGKVTVTR